jgi:hypothetical protein
MKESSILLVATFRIDVPVHALLAWLLALA